MSTIHRWLFSGFERPYTKTQLVVFAVSESDARGYANVNGRRAGKLVKRLGTNEKHEASSVIAVTTEAASEEIRQKIVTTIRVNESRSIAGALDKEVTP